MPRKRHARRAETPSRDKRRREPEGAESAGGGRAGNPVVRVWHAIQARRWSRWAFDLALFGLLLWGVVAWQTRDLVDTGGPAPDLTLPALDGSVHRLSDLRGQKVVVEFWAPSCPVCGAQAGNIESIADGGDTPVLSVAVDYPSRAAVEAFVGEHEVTVPVLLGDTATQRAWRVDAYPTIYVIDEDGTIEHGVVGYTTSLGLRFRLWF